MAAGSRGRSGEVKGFVPNRNITRPLIIFLPSNEKPLRRSDASGRADRVCAKFPAPVKKPEVIPCAREIIPCAVAWETHLASHCTSHCICSCFGGRFRKKEADSSKFPAF